MNSRLDKIIGWGWAIFVVSLVVAVALALSGCTVPESQATSAIEAMGMTNVQVGGYAFFGCDDKDSFASTFTATGANGRSVRGVVCSGLFKGATVRITG